MRKLHIDRLQKLADHLERGKLGHKVFYFGTYNDEGNQGFDKNGCGTTGCAIGECPIIFKDWKFKGFNLDPVYKNYLSIDYSVENFFGINNQEFLHLFIPVSQNIPDFGGVMLNINATKKQVAKNIELFIKFKTKKS